MSTATELQRIIDSKAAIKAAIESKGVTVGSGTLDTYAAKVDAIQTGGVVGTGTYLVRFFDFDGNILKQQRVNFGESATAPTLPTHQYLTFNSWNNAFSNVQSDIDTGAIYDTTDGKSYLFITLTTVTGLSPTLYFNKSTTSLMTIDWGDGTTSTSTTSGNQNINHTYAAAGDYVITVENSAGGEYYFGQESPSVTIFGHYFDSTYPKCLKYVYIGANMPNIKSYTFFNNLSLKNISISNTVTGFGGQVFQWCFPISDLIIPKSITSLSYVSYNNNITNIILPDTFIDISNAFGYNGTALKYIYIPQSVLYIRDSAFYNTTSVEFYIFKSLIPPSIAANSFSLINPATRIYVPDASLTAYKTATNWVTYADYIYPLSSKP